MTDRHGPGRRRDDRAMRRLAEERGSLIREHLKLTRQRARESRERTITLRVLIACVFVLVGVVAYGMAHTLPELRRAQDAIICSFRAGANREAQLARRDQPPSSRRVHQNSRDTFRALERASARGRRVQCKPLIARGRRP